jgi:hypothetical protein
VQRNSQINNDEIEKLLEIAERTERRPSKYKTKDGQVDRYIEENNIKAGKTRVPGYIIYFHYFTWKEYNRRSRQSFFRAFGKFFEKTQIQHGTGFFLDPAPFDLTPEGYFKARALLRRERNDVKREKQKKATKKSD